MTSTAPMRRRKSKLFWRCACLGVAASWRRAAFTVFGADTDIDRAIMNSARPCCRPMGHVAFNGSPACRGVCRCRVAISVYHLVLLTVNCRVGEPPGTDVGPAIPQFAVGSPKIGCNL